MLQEAYDQALAALSRACVQHYGDRLESLVVFGSVGRRTQRFDSDIDVLVVAHNLPDGRMPRVAEFALVEDAVTADFARRIASGVGPPELSPVFKTPEELESGSLLLLDMVDDARVLYDPRRVFAERIERLRHRLSELGAVRRRWGGGWYWHLKPDLKPGEVFEL